MTDVEQKPMTKTEREELKLLARERARVAKHDAQRRTADLKAMVEVQIADAYSYNNDETWNEVVKATREIVARAQTEVGEACENIGVPAGMQPMLTFDWQSRGPFQVAGAQQNLRRLANKRIEAQERAAIAEIDRAALEIQTNLVRAGLTSDTALDFLSAMPSVADLMPAVTLDELEQPRNGRREIGMGDDDVVF